MNKIYYNSPFLLQHIYTSLYGFKLKKKRYNKLYKSNLKNYVHFHVDSIELLKILLEHLKHNIKYYKTHKIDVSNPIESFMDLPFTTKDDLRENLEIRSCKKGDIIVEKTGGTTGKSLKVYSSKHDRAFRMAYLDYIKLKNGVKPFSKRASFTGKEIVPPNHKNILWRYNLPMNQILYASFKLNPKNVRFIYENMERNKPKTIDGFPSSIHLVAKYILSNNIQVDWEILGVFPTAETLEPYVKEDIEKAFNTKVYDQYASSEGSPFIYSNRNGQYVIGKETGVFEFFKVEEYVYEMVVTSFINFATPIVRYRIGDRVKIISSKSYLNSLQDDIVIERILGRETDYLIGDTENIVTSANMSNVVKDLGDKIIQSQFVQKSSQKFIVNLVVSNDYIKSKDEHFLKYKLTHRLGKGSTFVFNYLEEIPKESSGKTRFIINEMGE